MDYQLLPQVYPIRVEDRQHSPEETFHRYDEVIRALPASTPTYAAFATDYFLNTSLFSDSERLGIILRALGIHPYLRESDLTQEDIVRIAHKLTMTCGQAVSSYGQFGTLTSKQWQLLKRQGRSSKQATPAGTQADYITHKGKTTVLDPEAIQSIARLIAQMYLTRFVTPHDLEIAWQSASR